MNRTWELTGLEYVVLLEKLLGHSLPWPLSYVTDIELQTDFLREKQRVWDYLLTIWDGDLADLISEEREADARVHAKSWDARDTADPAGFTRLVGSRFGERALVVRQLPGPQVDHSNGFVLTECAANRLATVLVDQLPAMEAGSQDRVELMTYHTGETVDHWHGRSNLRDSGDDIEARSRVWQSTPRSTVGIINIWQGRSVFGPRGKTVRRVFWEDHPGDGRYAIMLDSPMAAVGIDGVRLATMIDTEIAEVIRVLQDESRDGIDRGSIFDE